MPRALGVPLVNHSRPLGGICNAPKRADAGDLAVIPPDPLVYRAIVVYSEDRSTILGCCAIGHDHVANPLAIELGEVLKCGSTFGQQPEQKHIPAAGRGCAG